MTLFVGHLNEKIKDPALRELFEPYGTIASIDRKGTYAFIEYAPGADSARAVHDLNRKEMLGTVIRVELSNRERGQTGPPPGDLSETCYNCQQVGHIARNCPLQAQPSNQPHWQRIKQQQQQRPLQKPKSPQYQYKHFSSQSLYEQEWASGPPPKISHQQSRLAKRGGMLDRNPGKIHLSASRGHPYWPNALPPAGGDGVGSSSRGKAKYASSAQPQQPAWPPGPPTEQPNYAGPPVHFMEPLTIAPLHRLPQFLPRTAVSHADGAFGRPTHHPPSHGGATWQGLSGAHQPELGPRTMPNLLSSYPAQSQHYAHSPESAPPPPLSPPSTAWAAHPGSRIGAYIPAEGVPAPFEYSPRMVPGAVMYVPVLAMPPQNHQPAHPSQVPSLAQPVLLPQPLILPPGSPPPPLVAIHPHLGSALCSLSGMYLGPAAATRESTASAPDPPESTLARLPALQPFGQPPPKQQELHEPGQQASRDKQPELAAAADCQPGSALPAVEDKPVGVAPLSAGPNVSIEPLSSTAEAGGAENASAVERSSSDKHD